MSIPLKRYWNLLVTYLRPQSSRVVMLAALLLGSAGLQLANPQVLRSFIDSAMAGSAPRDLTLVAALFIGIALVQQVLSILATYVGENVGWSATNKLRSDLARHCLGLDMAFHKTRTPGELIERIDGDVTVLANFFTQFAVQVLGNAILLAGVLALLFREDWRVGLALTVIAGVALATLHKIRDIAVPLWGQARQASAELFGFVEERLAGTEDIRSSGAQDYTMRRLYALMRELLLKNRKAAVINQATNIAGRLLFVLGNAVGLALGAYLFWAGSVTIGTVYLISYYIGLLTMPLEQITRQLQDLQKAGASIARVEELYQVRSAIQDGDTPLPGAALAVAFEGVSFEYDDQEPRTENQEPSAVSGQLQRTTDDGQRTTDDGLFSILNSQFSILNSISFSLAPGKVLGLLGRTGSGKTTITRLLLRLYDPSAGVIRLGGVDLRAARLEDIRERVGMVTQDVQLFRASIRDNLTFFNRGISDQRILAAIEELGLWEWYQSLPDGLDTMLAAGGGGLSAGEAQILAFARVFLKNPGLVILDEASSRLDPATERLIEGAVDRLLRNRTGIIIAHRLHTVQRADEIMILEGGRVAERGPRDSLIDDPLSRFAHLLKTGLEEALA